MEMDAWMDAWMEMQMRMLMLMQTPACNRLNRHREEG
jgi:hypothetical protein